MKRWLHIVTALLLVAAAGTTFAAEKLVKENGTLFLCTYEKSLKAEYAAGDAVCTGTCTALVADADGAGALVASARKTDGARVPEGSDAKAGQAAAFKGIGYKTAGNLDAKQGMLEMDVKILFAEDKKDGMHYMFYTGEPDKSLNMSVLVNKDTARLVLSMTDKAAAINQFGRVPVANELLDGKWHRIGFSWGGGKMSVYMDGKELSSMPSPASIPFGEMFYVGGNGHKLSNNADSLIRAIRISNTVKSGGGQAASVPAPAAPSSPAAAPSSTNLVANPGFEDKEKGWKILTDSKEFKIDSSISHKGNNSLFIKKDDDSKDAVIETADYIPVAAGQRYQLRLYYHTPELTDFSISTYRLTMSVTGFTADGKPVSLGQTGTRTSIPVVSLPGEWQENIYWFTPGAGVNRVKVAVTAGGSLRKAWIDDVSLYIYNPAEYPQTRHVEAAQPGYEWSQVEEMLKGRKSSSGKVVTVNGQPKLMIDGAETPPLFYKARGKLGYGYYNDFKGTGLKLVQFSINVGGTYPEIWQGKGKYDFERLDKLAQLTLQGNPDSFIVPVFSVGGYATWAAENPGNICTDQDGNPAMGWVEREYFGAPKKENHKGQVTYYSLKLRKDIDECLKDIIAHMKEQPYYKAVVGFGFTGGHDGQWRNQGVWFSNWIDYSPAARECFRDYMQRKYKTEDALRRAIGQIGATFATLEPPSREARTAGQFRDPSRDALAAEYSEFLSMSVAEMLEGFGKTAKENAGKDVFVSIYYTDTAGGMARYMEGMQKMYTSPWLDMFQTVAEYNPWRQPGAPGGVAPAYGSMAVNNKIWLQEYDHRTWVWPAFDRNSDSQFCFLMSPQDFNRVTRRDMGEKIALSNGAYYYDLSGGYFHAPEMTKEIDLQEKFYEKALKEKMGGIKPQMALIVDEKSCWWVTETNIGLNSNNNCTRPIVMNAQLAGVPYSIYSLDDLVSGKVPDCKVYIFLNTFRLDAKSRAYIDKNLKNSGRTLAWLYAPGYIDETTKSAGNIARITGINITGGESDLNIAARFADKPALAPGNSPKVAGGPAMARFDVADKAARPVAEYTDGKIAAAVKDLGGWRSVYIGNPGLCTAGLMNSMARSAGAYVTCESGFPVRVTDKFLSIHGTRPGPVEITLPRRCRKVTDAFTGKVLAENTDRIKLDVKLKETQWLVLE